MNWSNRITLLATGLVTMRTVRVRTAKVILDLSSQGQKTICRRQYSNLELAALVATCLGALSRSLRTLKDADVIDCTRL